MNTVPQKVADFLNTYSGNSSFILSVRSQFMDRGTLSDKQIAAVERNLAPRPVVAAPAPAPMANASYSPGSVLEIKSFIARKLAEQFNMAFQFRNVEILETLRETDKAIQVRVKLSPRYNTSCVCCGRELDTAVSRATGIGPICAEKMGVDRYAHGDAQQIIKQLEEQLAKINVNEPVWIPRSQIKGMVEQQQKEAV